MAAVTAAVASSPVRIATWNVNSLNARLAKVTGWLADVGPDVVCLQETKLADDSFPALTFSAMGYDAAHVGQGQWNGVAILSRVGLTDVAVGFGDGGTDDAEARLVWATCGGVRVASVYVPNGRALDDEQYGYKLRWLERLRQQLAECDTVPMAVCGDYNIAPGDEDVWDMGAFVDSTHVSEPERMAFRALLAEGLVDLVRARYPDPGIYTYWDYRAGNFHQGRGMRIDHMLVTAVLADRCQFLLVDRNARKGKKPSDHTVVVADFEDS